MLGALPYHRQLEKQFLLLEINVEGLVMKIAQEYDIVPYHNFTHGFTVFASFYELAQAEGVAQYFDDFMLFFALLACISHDIGHRTSLVICSREQHPLRNQGQERAGNRVLQHLSDGEDAPGQDHGHPFEGSLHLHPVRETQCCRADAGPQDSHKRDTGNRYGRC